MRDMPFKLRTSFTLTGDQPEAVRQIVGNLNSGINNQILLGVTGSGKTFTMANVIKQMNRPALIMAPNKTLAAQLYQEFKALFPDNAVHYFVSYYDYYRPEAYVPASDTYIEKDASINDDIDKMRHAATHALLTRRDVIIIASVSCIYGLGSPEAYYRMVIPLEERQNITMHALKSRLIEVQYTRNDTDFHRGTFRLRGDVLEIIPAYEHEQALRIEFFGDEIEAICLIDALTGDIIGRTSQAVIYPASHYVTDRDTLSRAMLDIREELRQSLHDMEAQNRLLEAQRLNQRTQLDLEMMEELGYCTGIENYSRHLDNRKQGDPPATLLDYFPPDFLLFIDESHITIPQIGAMSRGDKARKETLVRFGFRLPSALDNRPLTFEEFLARIHQCVFVSATPGRWEKNCSQGVIAEQLIRPTGVPDPAVFIFPVKGQTDHLLGACRKTIAEGNRVLITVLTKRMAEELTDFFRDMGVNARYLHSDIDTMERLAIIRALRAGEFDVLIGINLLREGLDIPEVALVAILDADREGFLRSTDALIQTFGRAARNIHGTVYLYADTMTSAMREAMDETARRRSIQLRRNVELGIIPTSVSRSVSSPFDSFLDKTGEASKNRKGRRKDPVNLNEPDPKTPEEMDRVIRTLEKRMRELAKALEFEAAAEIRDRITALRLRRLSL
ncbi:MAG: excinuclease ABC subunit UvrB [Desulfovibrionaceae bacterium]|nr:excinuclease ABC subunit UvrB [Desulfovibrionaceae bacterium]